MTGTQEGRRVAKVPLFLNGEGMRGGRVHPQIAWAKLRALSEGAALASKKLWGA